MRERRNPNKSSCWSQSLGVRVSCDWVREWEKGLEVPLCAVWRSWDQSWSPARHWTSVREEEAHCESQRGKSKKTVGGARDGDWRRWITVDWLFLNVYGSYIAPTPQLSWEKPEHFIFDNIGPLKNKWTATSACPMLNQTKIFRISAKNVWCITTWNWIIITTSHDAGIG